MVAEFQPQAVDRPGEQLGAVVLGDDLVKLVGKARAGRKAAAPLVAGDAADAEPVADDGSVERDVPVIIGLAILGGMRDAERAASVERVEIGILGNEADRAAHRTQAVERALGPAQHLDPLDVERTADGGVVAVGDDVGRLIEIIADGAVAVERGDAADLVGADAGGIAAAFAGAGHQRDDLAQVAVAFALQFLALESLNGDRHVLEKLLTPLGGDDDTALRLEDCFGVALLGRIGIGDLSVEREECRQAKTQGDGGAARI